MIKFDKTSGLIPAIIQDYESSDVYMLGYLNAESLSITQQTGFVHFWSRSRQKIWMKGEESGNKLKVVKILRDCDDDTLLIQVELIGDVVCHTGNKSCFYRELEES